MLELDFMELRKRLIRFAVAKFRCSEDVAEDMASETITNALALNVLSEAYCLTAMKNNVLHYYRDRRTRNEDYAPLLDEKGEVVEFANSATRPNQEIRLIASECAEAIGNLPDDLKQVMQYAAQQYSVEEIAELLDIAPVMVKNRLAYARRLLRDRAGYEIERKKGHHKFIGIRKRHHIWEARIKIGESDTIIGYYNTASEAAKAFEARAIEIRGADYLQKRSMTTVREAVKASGRSAGWLRRNKCSSCKRSWLAALRSGCDQCSLANKDFGTKGTWGGTWN